MNNLAGVGMVGALVVSAAAVGFAIYFFLKVYMIAPGKKLSIRGWWVRFVPLLVMMALLLHQISPEGRLLILQYFILSVIGSCFITPVLWMYYSRKRRALQERENAQ